MELNNVAVVSINPITNRVEEISMENRREVVAQYVINHQKPDQDVCPEMIQDWRDASRNYIYWSNKNGHRNHGTINASTKNYWLRCPVSGYYYGTYIKAIPEYGMMEVANIVLKGNRGKEGEIRDWEYDWYADDRKFFFLGDNGYYDIAGRRHEASNPYYHKDVLHTIHTGYLNGYFTLHHYEDEIKKLIPDIQSVDSVYDLEKFYKNGWCKREESKKMKSLGEIKLSMPDFSDVNPHSHRVHLFEQVNEDYVVFRIFNQDYRWNDGGREWGDWDEDIRIFITKKGKPSVMKHRYSTGWKLSTARIYTSWADENVTLMGEDIIDTWLPLKYIKSIIDFRDKGCAADMVATMRHPIIEQLVKSGYPEIAKELQRDNQIAANLKNAFRVDKETKQPLYKLLGVNKWLLQAVENYTSTRGGYYYNTKLQIIYQIKWLYNRFDISDLSKETIDLLIYGIDHNEGYHIRRLANMDSYYWRRETWAEVPEEEREFVFKLFRMKKKNPDNPLIRTYMDTLSLYDRISAGNRPDVNLKRFDDYNDLVNLHDRLNEIVEREYEERQARWNAEEARRLEAQKELFKKLQTKRRETFNAESDNYIIRVPETLEEISQEGLSLHHCVGGYLRAHATGETTIIFLRKKENPDESFYTIEVKNNEVIQIHGSHNKWLGNDPDAVPFVWKWIKDRGIICPKYIPLNKGAGYCKGSESLDESYLTKEVK